MPDLPGKIIDISVKGDVISLIENDLFWHVTKPISGKNWIISLVDALRDMNAYIRTFHDGDRTIFLVNLKENEGIWCKIGFCEVVEEINWKILNTGGDEVYATIVYEGLLITHGYQETIVVNFESSTVQLKIYHEKNFGDLIFLNPLGENTMLFRDGIFFTESCGSLMRIAFQGDSLFHVDIQLDEVEFIVGELKYHDDDGSYHWDRVYDIGTELSF